jgi:hypothetical protein
MKLLKIIINFLKGNSDTQAKTNYKQKNYKYIRNKWGFISKEIDTNKEYSPNNKK